ncbi:hypothetical protein A8F94_02350 [Bacillus sp. FJAT-27225]|nr:hypothetical protein A8F94_02350 [Bacillus sp. FJAT-27225]
MIPPPGTIDGAMHAADMHGLFIFVPALVHYTRNNQKRKYSDQIGIGDFGQKAIHDFNFLFLQLTI